MTLRSKNTSEQPVQKRYEAIDTLLRGADIRPTKQRLQLGGIIFGETGDKRHHFTADDIFKTCQDVGLKLSLATLYNSLNSFLEAGLLNKVMLDNDRHYFDTNTSDHHHIYDTHSETLTDIHLDALDNIEIPDLPHGKKLKNLRVIIEVENA